MTSLPNPPRSQPRSWPFALLAFFVVTILLSAPRSQARTVSQDLPQPQRADASAYIATLPPSPRITEYAPPKDQYDKAVAYNAAHYRHYFVNALYGFLTLLLILHLRLAAKFRNLAERVSSRRGVQLLLFAPIFLITLAAFSLPSELWDEYLSRRFGLSIQSWGSWFSDWTTNQLLSLILGTVFIAVLYALLRHSPRRWWFYFWMASIPLLLAAFFMQPLVIDPLFFKFTPLEADHPSLVTQIQEVVAHGGMKIPPERMFQMNASSKQTEGAAYVTGFGASKRAVFSDNMLDQLATPETLFVFGHEMGHYALQHIPKEIVTYGLLFLGLIWLGYRLACWANQRWGWRWGIRSLDDWASLPLLLLVGTVVLFLATPLLNGISRYFEHEADRYGLEVIHGIVADPGQAAARAFEKTGEQNLADPRPTPFIKLWFFDHPTRPERVHFVTTYDPWSNGLTPKYVP